MGNAKARGLNFDDAANGNSIVAITRIIVSVSSSRKIAETLIFYCFATLRLKFLEEGKDISMILIFNKKKYKAMQR